MCIQRRTSALRLFLPVLGAAFLTLFALVPTQAQTAVQSRKDPLGYQDTPLLPGKTWHVHDGLRPQPIVITPGTGTTGSSAPSDAIILFDGTDLSKWRDNKGNPTGWKVENGAIEVPKRGTPGGGDLVTCGMYGDCQLHIEFCSPLPVVGKSQGRGNSGVFLMGLYELQVLDTYGNETYPDGQAGAVYGQYPPLVNASRPPGQWQTYDVFWTTPRVAPDEAVQMPAYITVIHNGVLVQNHRSVLGPTGHRILAKYDKNTPVVGPLKLQDHGEPVRYRNIWIRPLAEDTSL